MKKAGCAGCGCTLGIFGFVAGIIWLTAFSNVCARMMGEETYPIKGNPKSFDPIVAIAEIKERVGRNAVLTDADFSSVRSDGTLNLDADYSPAPTATYRLQLPLDKAPDGKTAPPIGAGRGPDDIWVEPVTVRVYHPGDRRHVSRISGGSRSSYNYTNEGMDLDRSTPYMQKLQTGITDIKVTPKEMWEMAKKLGANDEAVATIRISESGYDFRITGTGVDLRWDKDGKLATWSLNDDEKRKLGIKDGKEEPESEGR